MSAQSSDQRQTEKPNPPDISLDVISSVSQRDYLPTVRRLVTIPEVEETGGTQSFTSDKHEGPPRRQVTKEIRFESDKATTAVPHEDSTIEGPLNSQEKTAMFQAMKIDDMASDSSKLSGDKATGQTEESRLEHQIVERRLKMLRILSLLQLVFLFGVHLAGFFQLDLVFYWRVMYMAFTLGDVLSIAILLLSFCRPALLKYSFHIFIFVNLTVYIRKVDFDGQDKQITVLEARVTITSRFSWLFINIFVYLTALRSKKGQVFQGVLLTFLNCACLALILSKDEEGVFSLDSLVEVSAIVFRTFFNYLICLWSFSSMNFDTFGLMKSSRDQQKEFRIIFHSLEESLLIIQESKIKFANNQFLKHFRRVIRRFIRLKSLGLLDSDSENESSQAGSPSTAFTTLWQWICPKALLNEKSVEDENLFMKVKVFREHDINFVGLASQDRNHKIELSGPKRVEERSSKKEVEDAPKDYALNDFLSMSVEELAEKKFVLLESDSKENNEVTAKSLARRQYVKVKRTQYQLDGKDKVILQFKDITNDILQDQYKNENELLEMINACVSHELRNPLNSIAAQNIEKESIYNDLERLVSDFKTTDKESEECQELFQGFDDNLVKLRRGQKIQNSSAEIMTFIVQDLLDYAQIKAGKFRKNIEGFDIIEAVEQVASIQRKKAEGQGIRLFTEFLNIAVEDDPSGQLYSPIVNTDRQRVMQVLLGLQSNAIKFTQEGSVTIKTRIVPVKDASFLEISVVDTGIGIAYEDQDKLFKLFGFLNSSKQLNTKGIGLGLVISDQIVSQFGGQITFSSVPGQGSTFKFTFLLSKQCMHQFETFALSDPEESNRIQVNQKELIYRWGPGGARKLTSFDYVSSLKATSSVQLSENQIAPDPEESSDKILLVDDQIYNLEALDIILKYKVGVDTERVCDRALNGEKALAMVSENIQRNHGRKCDYKLIFMDCNMPHMDGYEAADLIRRLVYDKGLPQPIISAVTGHSEQMYVEKAVESGMNQVLTKPVKGELLKQLVEDLGM